MTQNIKAKTKEKKFYIDYEGYFYPVIFSIWPHHSTKLNKKGENESTVIPPPHLSFV